jgi:hypothetical protein
MSSVNGSYETGQYMQSLQKHYSEADEDLATERKRNRELTQEQIESIEKKSRENQRRLEEKIADALNASKETSQEEYHLQRERLMAEIAEAKAKLYDKQGRSQNPEVATYRKLLANSQKEVTRTKEAADQRLRNLEDYYSERETENAESNSQKLERALTESSHRANKTIQRVAAEQKEISRDLIEQQRDSIERLTQDRIKEKEFGQRFVQKAVQQANDIADARMKKADQYAEKAMHDENKSRHDDAEVVAKKMRVEHQRETDKLRQDIRDLVEAEKHYVKDRAQATQDAIRDFEPVFRAREASIQKGYEDQLDKAKIDASSHETRLARERLEDMREKDRYFSGLISQQTENNQLREKEIQQTFQRDRALLERMAKDERDRSNERSATLVRDLTDQREHALNQQARAYQDTIARYRQQADDQVRSLEGELQRKTAPGDKTLISPAAEEDLRKKMTAEYDRKLTAEQNRAKNREEALREAAQDKLRAEIKTRQSQVTEVNQKSTRERFQERGDLLTLLTETKMTGDANLQIAQNEHSRQLELTHRNQAQQSENLRAQYEEILRAQSDESAQKMDQLRQQTSFESKMMARQFATRQTELIREYERKLNDTRAEFKAELNATKVDAERQIRENDRKNRYTLQEQARSYEERIATMETQHEERLRVVAQNYDEDLNKIRRTNAEILRNRKS